MICSYPRHLVSTNPPTRPHSQPTIDVRQRPHSASAPRSGMLSKPDYRPIDSAGEVRPALHPRVAASGDSFAPQARSHAEFQKISAEPKKIRYCRRPPRQKPAAVPSASKVCPAPRDSPLRETQNQIITIDSPPRQAGGLIRPRPRHEIRQISTSHAPPSNNPSPA